MSLLNLNPFFTANQTKIYIGTALLAVVLAVGFYIKDRLTTNKLATQSEQVQVLNQTILTLKGEKQVLAKQAEDSVQAFKEQKTKADASLAKLANLKDVVVPIITSTNVSPGCLEEIQSVQRQYTEREVVFRDVIQTQQVALTKADTAIATLQEEVKADNAIIAAHEEKDKVVDKKTKSLEGALKSETTRKVWYRATAGVLVVIVAILL
jgi:hypothetical protein